jgi:hypothetical protein
MRLTTDRRWQTLVALAIASAIVVTGCDNKPKAANDPNSPTTAEGSRNPRQIVEPYLAELAQGKVIPGHLTATFRNSLSKPKADPESDVRDYLAKFKDSTFSILEDATFGNAIVVRGRAQSADRKDAFTLRLVKEGDGYKIDWLHRSAVMGINFKEPADPDLAAAQDVVRNFVDILLGGDVRVAHALMTPKWKTKLAGPTPADLKDGYDHSPGFLTQTTRTWKGDSIGYSSLTSELNAAKDEATIRGDYDARNGSKSPFILKATKVDGRWLVAGFEQQRS